jgi:hypothetical protein
VLFDKVKETILTEIYKHLSGMTKVGMDKFKGFTDLAIKKSCEKYQLLDFQLILGP